MRLFSFRNFRVLILLILLAMAAIHTSEQKLYSTSWHRPLEVTLFPINSSGSGKVDRYVENLRDRHFRAVDRFIAREAKRYDVVAPNPTITRLGPEIAAVPPQPNIESVDMFEAIFLSLKLRWWVFRNTPDDKSNKRRVRMFVLFHDPSNETGFRHSLGFQKGLFGIVHAYAHDALASRNNVIIAHELLHTVGATDKYGPDAQPLHPHGYADPDRQPLHPQQRAEIMAVRIPLSETESLMPANLNAVIVGPKTAREINWASRK